MTTPTPGQQRTAKARATRTQAKHRRWIEELQAAGMDVLPPRLITADALNEGTAKHREWDCSWCFGHFEFHGTATEEEATHVDHEHRCPRRPAGQ